MARSKNIKVSKIRILSFLLAIVLFFANGAQLTAYAAPLAEFQEKTGTKALSALAITGFDEPVAGVPFDGTATVTSAEGVTWEIPVIWTDGEGNIVTVPVSGKKYIPTFVFYIPEGYTVPGISARGRFAVKLPAFLVSLYGTDDLLFTVDPSTGVTFISCGVSQYLGFTGIAGWGVSSAGTAPEVSAVSSQQDTDISEPAPEPQQEESAPAEETGAADEPAAEEVPVVMAPAEPQQEESAPAEEAGVADEPAAETAPGEPSESEPAAVTGEAHAEDAPAELLPEESVPEEDPNEEGLSF